MNPDVMSEDNAAFVPWELYKAVRIAGKWWFGHVRMCSGADHYTIAVQAVQNTEIGEALSKLSRQEERISFLKPYVLAACMISTQNDTWKIYSTESTTFQVFSLGEEHTKSLASVMTSKGLTHNPDDCYCID